MVKTVPMAKPAMYSQAIDSQPSHQASGMLATISASIDSPATYTGSLRTRSSHTPDGSENSTKGAISIALSRPICVGVACSSTAAVSGSASIVTWPPKELIRIELHSRRYTASRSRSFGGRLRWRRQRECQALRVAMVFSLHSSSWARPAVEAGGTAKAPARRGRRVPPRSQRNSRLRCRRLRGR